MRLVAWVTFCVPLHVIHIILRRPRIMIPAHRLVILVIATIINRSEFEFGLVRGAGGGHPVRGTKPRVSSGLFFEGELFRRRAKRIFLLKWEDRGVCFLLLKRDRIYGFFFRIKPSLLGNNRKCFMIWNEVAQKTRG